MKTISLALLLAFTISTFGQTKPTTTTTTTTTTVTTETIKKDAKPATTPPKTSSTKTKSTSTKAKSTTSTSKSKTSETKSGDKVVKKALYTPAEKEKTRQNFINDIDEIGMSPEVRTEYTAIVKKHWERISVANNERKLTKDQATDYVNRVIKEQNSEIQPILTVEQFNKHMLIMNRYQNSVLYRIEQQ